MPSRFLVQVLRKLSIYGVLHSTRGVRGGYCLARPLDEISLLDIFEIIDYPLKLNLPFGHPEELMEKLGPLLGQGIDRLRADMHDMKLTKLI